MTKTILVALAALCLAACGSEADRPSSRSPGQPLGDTAGGDPAPGDSNNGDTNNGDPSPGDNNTSSDPGTGDNNAAGDNDTCPPVPDVSYSSCLQNCASAADCHVELPTNGAFGADNYICDGVCRYDGCNSDAECQISFAATERSYKCIEYPCTGGARYCGVACTTPADCVISSGAAYDADNWSCLNNGCIYAGCNSDAECADSLGAGNVCDDNGACVKGCLSAADCALTDTGINAESHYECNSGRCTWLGCLSDYACEQTFMSDNYSCAEL